MKVVSTNNLARARHTLHAKTRDGIARRAEAEAQVLHRVWREVLAPGPRSGRMYRHNGRLYQASAPGEVPQAVTEKLRNTIHTAVSVAEVSRGWRATVTISSPQAYAPILIRLHRVIGAAVIDRARPILRRMSWPR